MGMTRATGGPVRCPWCARPVSDGPGSPESCPSCGVPLSPAIVGSREVASARRPSRPGRSRKSQRLRALATVLALTAVMLVISAIGVAAALLRTNHSDDRARTNLQVVLRAAEAVKRETGSFTQATPAALHTRASSITVIDGQAASATDHEISMAVAKGGDGWYGAVRSRSGRCFVAATVDSQPVELTLQLPANANCTGEVARAALMTLPLVPAVMSPSTTPAGSSTG